MRDLAKMSLLLKAHGQYMKKARQAGHTVLEYATPCCGAFLDTVAPKDEQVWDSLTSCPFCGELFMKVCTRDSVTAAIPKEMRK